MVILNCINDKFYLSGRLEFIKSVFPEINEDLLCKFKNSESSSSNNGAILTFNENENETTNTTTTTKEDASSHPPSPSLNNYLTRLCINDLDIGMTHLVQLMERLYDNHFSLEAHYSQSSNLSENKMHEKGNNIDDDDNGEENDNIRKKCYEYVFVKS
jgi:DNA topoisomerase IA